MRARLEWFLQIIGLLGGVSALILMIVVFQAGLFFHRGILYYELNPFIASSELVLASVALLGLILRIIDMVWYLK
jgi:hypothetical protein